MRTWGTSAQERAAQFPIDHAVDVNGGSAWRGVTIQQTPEKIWPWVGQLRLAPYAYDWLDNGMHRSPQHLVTDLPPIAVGDPFMVWPRVIDLEPLRTLTFLCRSYDELDGRYGGGNWFANIAQKPGYLAFNLDWIGGSYRLVEVGPTETRLLVKLRWKCRDNFLASFSDRFLQFADFVMMRRQLLNLKALAESASTDRGGPGIDPRRSA